MSLATPTSGANPIPPPMPPYTQYSGVNQSILAPFQIPLFRALWFAFLASNVGTWIHDVGAAWLMTELHPSKLLVSMVQAAEALPIFLLSLPAGALADILDRRRILMFTQAWMLAAAALLGFATILGLTDPTLLLFMTFLLNIGSALNGPAWQAVTPELVGRELLPAAITANSVAFNLARAVGPAIGGLIVGGLGGGMFGSGAAFLINAGSFFGVILVIYRWHRTPRPSVLPTERFIGATKAGIRFALHAPPLQAALIRTAAFALGASALWALLPVVARLDLNASALGYGLMVGSLGIGAVASAFGTSYLRKHVSSDKIVAAATILYAAALVGLGLIRSYYWVLPVMSLAGIAWIAAMSNLNVAVQSAAPGWVKARALSIYLLTFFGCMAGGSVLWGFLADHITTRWSLLLAAAAVVAGMVTRVRFPILSGPPPELVPAGHWPTHELTAEPDLEDGPVLITIDYRVKPENLEVFTEAMRAWRHVRMRDGAIDWGLFNDANDPTRCVEWFLVESWADHLRQHERITLADRALQEKIWSYHTEPDRPKANHFVAMR